MATTCTTNPPPASPVTPPPESSPDASSSNWTVPAVPLAKSRTVLLFQPPPTGPDASALVAIAPDPAPLVEQQQWVYDLRYDKGDVFLVAVHPVRLPAPRETPRVMGRFALELYSGRTLLERVRFDFPGLGGVDAVTGADGDAGRRMLHGTSVSFTKKLTSRIGVMLPATSRGTRLELWDRGTGRRWPLSWPAVEMTTEEPDASSALR